MAQRKKPKTYAEWLNKQRRLEKIRKRKNRRTQRSVEVELRFQDGKLSRLFIYRRHSAIELGRQVNPNLVKRDGVWQQRAKYSITIPTTFGNVLLTTNTRGLDTKRTRKRKNSFIRDSYTIDAFDIDSSKCLVRNETEVRTLHNDIELFLINKEIGYRKKPKWDNTPTIHRVAFSGKCPVTGKDVHVPFPNKEWQGKKKKKF
jgi:hypothetical protein